ncbi:hypothetical protein JTE90_003519, partial [Oedothorax gibbosus]
DTSTDSALFQDSINSVGNSIRRKISVGMSNLLSQKYESLDYDVCENALFVTEQKKEQSRFLSEPNKTCVPFLQCLNATNRVSVMRWFVIFLIGILTAIVAVLINIAIEELSFLKFQFLKNCVDECKDYKCLSKTYYFWLLFSALPVAVGSLLVVFVA